MFTSHPQDETFRGQDMAEQGDIIIYLPQHSDTTVHHGPQNEKVTAADDSHDEGSHYIPVALCRENQTQEERTQTPFADTTILHDIPHDGPSRVVEMPATPSCLYEDACCSPVQGEVDGEVPNTPEWDGSSGDTWSSPLQNLARRRQQKPPRLQMPPSSRREPMDSNNNSFSGLVLQVNGSPVDDSSPSTCPSLCMHSSVDSGLTEDISSTIDWAYGQDAASRAKFKPDLELMARQYREIFEPRRDPLETMMNSGERHEKEIQRSLESDDTQTTSVVCPEPEMPLESGSTIRDSHDQQPKKKSRPQPQKQRKERKATPSFRQQLLEYQRTSGINGVKKDNIYCPSCSVIQPTSSRPAKCLECLRVRYRVQRRQTASKSQLIESQAKAPTQTFLQEIWKKLVPLSEKKQDGRRMRLKQWGNVLAGQMKTAFKGGVQ